MNSTMLLGDLNPLTLDAISNGSVLKYAEPTTASNMSQPSVVVNEGGFLTGRNPFIFQPVFPLPTFIVQLVIIICMARIVKFIISPIKQPAVIAETISGIILGPTVLGHIPHFSATLFPKESLPFLNLMSNFGLVLFLFLVGLELDPRILRKSLKNSLVISLAGMALPFSAGVGVSFLLYSYVEPPSHQTGFTKYFLFLGVCMAITAFPVLARILSELNLLKTRVGSITISAAAVDDATSWCLLALVISFINAGSGLIAVYVFLIGLGYSLFLVFAVRPIYIKILRRHGAFDREPSQGIMFITLCLVFVSAFITDAVGIHAIFGGFLAGIIIPHEGGFAYHITSKLEDIVSIIFLPLYFALSGLRTSIGSLDDAASWGIVVLVIFVACFGKIVGCALAAKCTSMNWRESITVGCLMNCKGLVELIVLNLGYDANVISQKTFAIMVIMALVTTFITVPLVAFIYPPEFYDRPEENYPMTHKSSGKRGQSLLVSVNKIEQVPAILSIINLLHSKKARGKRSSIVSQLSLPLHSPKFVSKSPSEGSEKKHHHRMVINALRLIELTDRDSSVMLQTSGDALKNDPVMKMLRTFCEVITTNVRSLVKVVTMDNFSETLVKTAKEVEARYILVPWTGSGSVIEDAPVGPIQQLFHESHRRHSFHTPVQHASFISDLFTNASCSVLVLVDRGMDQEDGQQKSILQQNVPSLVQSLVLSYRKIVLPYFGGPDDREALEIVLGLSGLDDVEISVVRYTNFITRSHSRRFSNDSEMESVNSDDTITPAEILVVDTADDELLEKRFGVDGSRNDFTNLQFSQVESFNPVSSALRSLTQLSSNDLVIIGRGNIRMPIGMQFKNTDIERKKVLGDVAECILLSSCNASLLVVQGPRRVESI